MDDEKSMLDLMNALMGEEFMTKRMEVRLAGFIEGFHANIETGKVEKFCKDAKTFYDLLMKQGFTNDDAIRILSHSFTRMISEGG